METTATVGSAALAAAIGGFTVRRVLKELEERVQNIFNCARDAGSFALDEGARKLAFSIQTVQNAYIDSLDQTVDKVNRSFLGWVTDFLPLLEKLEKFENKTVEDTKTLITQARATLDSIRFLTRKIPTLYGIEPHYVVPSKSYWEIPVTFSGYFPDLAEFDVKLNMTVKTTGKIQETVPTRALADKIEFSVPYYTLIACIADRSKDGKGVMSSWAELEFTKRQSWLASRFMNPTRYSFKFCIGVLPLKPGKFSLETSKKIQTLNTREYMTNPAFQQNSQLEKRHIRNTYSVSPSHGWEIVRNTSALVPLVEQGKQGGNLFYSFEGDDAGSVKYSVFTRYTGTDWITAKDLKRGDVSGRMTFKIQFKESQQVLTEESEVENRDLEWGTSHCIDLKNRQWKLIYTCFDGSVCSFTRNTPIKHPILQVNEVEGCLYIEAKPPERIS